MAPDPSRLLISRLSVRILNATFTAISCDRVKRNWTLKHRQLDLLTCGEMFAGLHQTREDLRQDYSERRFITIGLLSGALCVVVWTDREPALHVISLRRANHRERRAFEVVHH
ncbi:MAG: BrnT family toxin [Burkholderiaceae bacterium]